MCIMYAVQLLVTCSVCLDDNFRFNEESVRRDHGFLEDDALEALFRSVLVLFLVMRVVLDRCHEVVRHRTLHNIIIIKRTFTTRH